MKRKILAGLAIAVVALIAVVVIRTVMHRPESVADAERVHVEVNATAAAEHLAEAIRIRTVSPQDPAAFDSLAFSSFLDWVGTTYPEVERAMEREVLGGYSLLYRWSGTDPTQPPILLTAHLDVVPVAPGTESQWEQPPFSGSIVDGVIWGRGAQDDKSGVVAQLEAASTLLAEGFRPTRTVYFSFGHDEELGGSRGAASVASHLQEQGVQLAWSLDEGSFLFDGMFPGVEPLLASINVAEKGSVTLQLVASAAGGHSSMPPTETAVGRLARAITALEENPVPGGLTGLSRQVFDNASRHMPFTARLPFANLWLFGPVVDNYLTGLNFGNAMLRTTTAPTMLSASVKVNVLPVEAVATVNFRIHPRDTVDGIVAHVESAIEGTGVVVRRPEGSGRPASGVADWDSEGFVVVARSVREVYGDVVITPGLMVAGTDSRHYSKVADNAFRFNPFVQTPEDLDGFHGTNERIGVENLANGIRTYVQILRNGAS